MTKKCVKDKKCKGTSGGRRTTACCTGQDATDPYKICNSGLDSVAGEEVQPFSQGREKQFVVMQLQNTTLEE